MGGKLGGRQTLGTRLFRIAQLVELVFKIAESKHR
jgi:hypothetical protein